MKIGTFCLVWKEARYLPLVLEQMSLCPGPALLYWQNYPWFWYGKGPAPSGHDSAVADIVKQFPKIEVIKVDRFPAEMASQNAAFQEMRRRGMDVTARFDSDWLVELDAMQRFYDAVSDSEKACSWNIKAQHYWRNFRTIHAAGLIRCAVPSSENHTWVPERSDDQWLDDWCYHASYVWTDEEIYDKVHSWGHADTFQGEKRDFYRDEWLGKNDAHWNARPADKTLPDEIVSRLRNWNALLEDLL